MWPIRGWIVKGAPVTPTCVEMNGQLSQESKFFEDLPLPASEKTCEHMNLVDVFINSFYSENWKNGAKSSKPNCLLNTSFGSTVLGVDFEVEVLIQDTKTHDEASFVFCSTKGQDKVVVDHENKRMMFFKKDPATLKKTFCDFYFDLIPHICQNVKFHEAIFVLTSSDPFLLREVFARLNGTSFNKISFVGCSVDIRSVEVADFLDKCHVDKLIFTTKNDAIDEFFYRRGDKKLPLTVLKRLRNLKYRELTVDSFEHFNRKKFHEYLRNWKKGSYEHLEKFEVVLKDEEPSATWDSYRTDGPEIELEIGHGLDARPWDSRQREEHAVERRSDAPCDVKLVNCRHGKDITRRDGTIGTILVGANGCVKFFVWKDRFPMKSIIPLCRQRLVDINRTLSQYPEHAILELANLIGFHSFRYLPIPRGAEELIALSNNKQDIMQWLVTYRHYLPDDVEEEVQEEPQEEEPPQEVD